MPLNVLFAARPESWKNYEAPLTAACREAGLDVTLMTEARDPEKIDYIVYGPDGALSDFSPFNGAKAVLSLWAGVETVTGNETLTQPLTRMVDSGLTEGMVEYVTGHVLRYHLGTDTHVLNRDGRWRGELVPPLAKDRRVTILGLGALGAACATALATLGFRVSGWSRSAKDIPGITCQNGPDGLRNALSDTEILVLLLPDTPATANIMNAERLSQMPIGARIINPGRGTLIDDEALLEALHDGQIEHATLDVFRTEPLPQDHPYWTHPKVTVTPHIASATRPDTASRVIAENIRRSEAGEQLLYLVDRKAGY